MTGKVAVVTGAARGIGAATARALSATGMSVVVVDRRDDLGTAVVAELGDRAIFVAADVTEPAGWESIVATAVESFGGIDVLVNNAAIIRVAPLLEMEVDTFDKVVATNLRSVFLGIRAVAPVMIERGGGSIVNLASPQAFEGRAGLAAYSSAKFGVRGLTRTAALELGPNGVRVNTVVPGAVRTPMLARPGWSDADYDDAYRDLPLGRIATPEDIAAMIAFLASDDSSYCTGADFVVDGGGLAGKPVPG